MAVRTLSRACLGQDAEPSASQFGPVIKTLLLYGAMTAVQGEAGPAPPACLGLEVRAEVCKGIIIGGLAVCTTPQN